MANSTTVSNLSDPSNPTHYSPSQTSLLLLDFHKRFLKALGPSASAAATTTANLRKWAKQQNIHIIHCLVDTSNPPPLATCKLNRMVEEIISSMSSGSLDAVEPSCLLENMHVEEITFIRPAYHGSALKSPGLQHYLAGKGVKSLILAGISSAGVVLRTALVATDEGFVVTVVEDACAEFKKEVHEVLMSEVLPARAHVVDAGEFMDGYEKVRGM